ncbi:guanylyl cyclase [Babesia caballi]|uniref:Guanylyl cyclase n=1 Tax=Babesia caballi TaxID=5871 RepID=A0AAV4LPT2_BABCB|nr:guanylyl cyclase [Babesia caballi]
MASKGDARTYVPRGLGTQVSFHKGENKRHSGQRPEAKPIITVTNKEELITKRQNLCFGTQLQTEWDTRCLKINPALSEDLHRFAWNEQYMQRWAWPQHALFIFYSNAKRLPYIWGAIILIISFVSPALLRSGSPKLSWYSHAAILTTSFGISFLMNGICAFRRYLVARCIDFKRYHVLEARTTRWKDVRACDLAVGNIVKLSCDDQVPADMIILACSNPDGQVHVDTTFLDGNRDLKVKYCTKDAKVEASIHSFANIRGQIVCDRPSPDLESFTGTLRLKGHPRPRNVYMHNFIMKGSTIRNTGTVYGIVTHAGSDTKIAQNIKKGSHCIKSGSIEGVMNQFTVIIAFIYLLSLLVSMGTRWSMLLESERRKKGAALVIESVLFILIRFSILYGGLVPVTLPAILDVLRWAFSTSFDGHVDYSFLNDGHTKDKGAPNSKDSGAILPLTWTMTPGLLEELGLVDIIFCDKTGTLTSNDLKISFITVGNNTYDASGDRVNLRNEIEGELEKNQRLDQLLKLMCLCNESVPVTSTTSLEMFTSPMRMVTSSSQMLQNIGSRSSDGPLSTPSGNQCTLQPSKSKIHFGNVSYIEPLQSMDFGIRNLGSMRHSAEFSAETTANEGDSAETYPSCTFPNRSNAPHNSLFYRSALKEDECMMDIARDLGYKLVSRSKSQIQIDVRGSFEAWNIIGFNNFNPQRRRMSVVLTRSDQEGSTLFVKGSGETMVHLIRAATEDEHREIAALPVRIEKLTSAGFRVLVCAYRDMTREETRTYQRHFENAEDSVYSSDTLHEEAAILVEKGLTYLGLIVFKDEIQPGVPETLDLLMEAGVRIWMTTGDNRYAAIEAAYSSRLLVYPCRIFDCKLPPSNPDVPLKDGSALYEAFLQQRAEKAPTEQLCLVIDGEDLGDLMATSAMQTYFVNMLCFADVVLACRLNPSQKAEFVKLVKARLTPTPVTLAIGDGLNDIKMMQEAHVGVAVLGSTPDAAVYADFVTTHFAGLRSLLFYQGNTCLQVIGLTIYWSFFKSICLVLPIFYYQGHTDWVGLDLYGSFIQVIFHLIFTVSSVTLCALFDKPLSEPVLTNLPVFYTLCRRRFHVNLLRLSFWILEGVLLSTFCYLSIQTTTLESPIFRGGGTISARAFGLICSLGVLEMANTRLLMEALTRNNFWGVAFMLLSLFAVPPTFLGLCFLFGGRTLKNATSQVFLWQPVYILIPVWISAGALCHVVSTLTYTSVSPNMGNYLKHWVRVQKCQCAEHSNGVAMGKESDASKGERKVVHTATKRKTKHTWCDRLMQKARKEFNPHSLVSLARMIPHARPFRVREGDLTVIPTAHGTAGKKFAEDTMKEEELQKLQSDVNLQNVRASRMIDPLTLRFKDTQLEEDYTLHKRKNHYRTNRIWYRVVFSGIALYYTVGWALDYVLKEYYTQDKLVYTALLPMLVTLFSFFCTIITFSPENFVHHIRKVLGALVCCMLLQSIVDSALTEQQSSLQPLLFPIFTFVILHLTFMYALMANVIFVLCTVKTINTSIHTVPMFIGINMFVAFVGYRLEYNNRKNFLFEFSARNARRKQSELLNTMLPTFVVSKMINARLNEDGIPIGFEASEHATVSILFCDVYQFQNLVAAVEPAILVELLDSLFLAFDRCADQFNATKIETVFETYLAALGLSRGTDPCPYESAANAIDMALAMLEAASQIYYSTSRETLDGSLIEENEALQVKVGINSGRAISGLVGAKKPQYALFGDTVNTASRMKSTGEVGHIHVTDSTYNLVKSDTTLHFDHREIFVKGKGVMTTHLLVSAGGSTYPNFGMRDSYSGLDTSRVNMSDDGGLGEARTGSFDGDTTHGNSGLDGGPPSTNNLLFECLDKGHLLNTVEQARLRATTYTGNTPIGASTYYTDYERACARRLRISAAIGALTEEGVILNDQLGPLRVCSLNSLAAGATHSATTRALECFPFRRRRRRTASKNNVRNPSNVMYSLSSPKQNVRDDDDEVNNRIDGTDLGMGTHEWLNLKFIDKLQEDRYRTNFYQNGAHTNTAEQTLVFFLIICVVQTILEIAFPRSFEDNQHMERLLFMKYTEYWTVRSVYIILVFLVWLLFHFIPSSPNTESNITTWLTFFVNFLFVSAACTFALSNSWAVARSGIYFQYLNVWNQSDSIKFYFYIVVLHHCTGMLFRTCLLVDALFLIVCMTFVSSGSALTSATYVSFFNIPCYICFNLLSAHYKESIDRRAFYSNEKARMIETRVGQMLNDMLPKSVLEEFRNDKLKMSYFHEKMSFLFSDIVGFTLWANSVDASEVVALLQRLFARFDRNSTKFGLYKLCTIGDAYVVVSEPAIEVPSDQEAIANIDGILQMAYSMIRTIQDVREAFNIPGLNMRIGLHYGCSVGGVIGSKRLSDIQVIDRCVRSYVLSSDANESPTL